MRKRVSTAIGSVLTDFLDLIIFFSLGAFLTIMVLAMK
jgi:hypothetical protein